MGEAISVIGLGNAVVVIAHFENNLRIVQYFIITGCLIQFYKVFSGNDSKWLNGKKITDNRENPV